MVIELPEEKTNLICSGMDIGHSLIHSVACKTAACVRFQSLSVCEFATSALSINKKCECLGSKPHQNRFAFSVDDFSNDQIIEIIIERNLNLTKFKFMVSKSSLI